MQVQAITAVRILVDDFRAQRVDVKLRGFRGIAGLEMQMIQLERHAISPPGWSIGLDGVMPWGAPPGMRPARGAGGTLWRIFKSGGFTLK